ncbi:hypothetical protein, partial [Rhizobium ruizarguesonis]|uniref:hypothetical protein n=2 Tax=Rhizobium ruizarguesonis TaxID=2081791 RepID=UPI001A8FE8B3
PASCSFNMPMICSSVKRLRFILWSSQWARAYFKMDYFNGARSLAEFFPFDWPKSQAGSHGLATLRSSQRNRFIAISDALRKEWDASPKLTPVAATQNCYMTDLQIA